MCDINTGKRGDVAIINTNTSYNLVKQHSSGHIGGRFGGREDGGEDNLEYEVVGTSHSGLPSQQTGESFVRGVGGNITLLHPRLTATSTGGDGGEEGMYEIM